MTKTRTEFLSQLGEHLNFAYIDLQYAFMEAAGDKAIVADPDSEILKVTLGTAVAAIAECARVVEYWRTRDQTAAQSSYSLARVVQQPRRDGYAAGSASGNAGFPSPDPAISVEPRLRLRRVPSRK